MSYTSHITIGEAADTLYVVHQKSSDSSVLNLTTGAFDAYVSDAILHADPYVLPLAYVGSSQHTADFPAVLAEKAADNYKFSYFIQDGALPAAADVPVKVADGQFDPITASLDAFYYQHSVTGESGETIYAMTFDENSKVLNVLTGLFETYVDDATNFAAAYVQNLSYVGNNTYRGALSAQLVEESFYKVLYYDQDGTAPAATDIVVKAVQGWRADGSISPDEPDTSGVVLPEWCFVTLQDVRLWLNREIDDVPDSKLDEWIDSTVPPMIRQAEKLIGRPIKAATHTETVKIGRVPNNTKLQGGYTNSVSIGSFPIITVYKIDIINTDGTRTAVDLTSSLILDEIGEVRFSSDLGSGWATITYRGGFEDVKASEIPVWAILQHAVVRSYAATVDPEAAQEVGFTQDEKDELGSFYHDIHSTGMMW